MRTLEDHLFGRAPKRILSLDGGGVRGLVSLGILEAVEDRLRARVPAELQPRFRLCHYFDLIGGTSTGGIIAALLALGWQVSEIRKAYLAFAPRVFKRKTGLLDRLRNPYNLFAPGFDAKEFKKAIEDVLDQHLVNVGRIGMQRPTLDSDLLLTGLCLVSKRIDTSSVWTLTNNPRFKWWDPKSPHWQHVGPFHANRHYPLGILAQATASAPFFLEAVELSIDAEQIGVFLDGGASPFNCPALELFQMTTLKKFDDEGQPTGFSPYGFDWPTGEENLLLYSVGTGIWRNRIKHDEYKRLHNWDQARLSLISMIQDNTKSSLTWLQAMSEPRVPWTIDGNLGDMRGLRVTPQKLLTFRRADVRLEKEELGRLGFDLTDEVLANTRRLDNAGETNLRRLDEIGRAAGKVLVEDADFPPHFEPVYGEAVRIAGERQLT